MNSALCGTHIPVLVKLLKHLDKPVLELGIGWSSTPLLHWMCKEKKLDLISIESDGEWIKSFRTFRSDTHSILQADENFTLDFELPDNFSLVFVDHKPARKRRASAVFFKDRADFIVLHDSELADHRAYKYTPIYDLFKYRLEYKGVDKPYTIVLSNRINLEEIF
jgi:hypothetical protein